MNPQPTDHLIRQCALLLYTGHTLIHHINDTVNPSTRHSSSLHISYPRHHLSANCYHFPGNHPEDTNYIMAAADSLFDPSLYQIQKHSENNLKGKYHQRGLSATG